MLRLRQLNALAGAGRAVVIERGGAHSLAVKEGIPLAVFADGILLRRGPFRP
jgi:hypothetical protein